MRLVDSARLLPQAHKARKLFDAEFYLERYSDVREAGLNPLHHYLRHGAAEGRKPHQLFEPEYYLSGCLEARKSANPLLHFLETGGRLGNPHPLFDCEAYLAAHPDVAARGENPLVDYLRREKLWGRMSSCAALLTPPSGSAHNSGGPIDNRPQVGQPAPQAQAQAQTARLTILDVEVEIEFWEDASGRLEFIAEPQQAPFFRAMRFDQLAAQIKA